MRVYWKPRTITINKSRKRYVPYNGDKIFPFEKRKLVRPVIFKLGPLVVTNGIYIPDIRDRVRLRK